MTETHTAAGAEISWAVAALRARRAAGIYDVLDHVASTYGLHHAWLVLAPEGSGAARQVFSAGRRHTDPDLLAGIASGPPGFQPRSAVPPAVADPLFALCDAELRAELGRAASAYDPLTGLLSSDTLDGALTRATACAGRYRWSTTAVMMTTAGDSPEEQRWLMLAASLRAALRAGDEAGAAAPGTAVALLGNTGRDDVRPFIARVRGALSSLGVPGAEDTDLLAAAASTPGETVDPTELLRLARERLEDIGGHVRPASEPGSPEGAWALELELRRLPEVRWVGVETADPGASVTVGVSKVTAALEEAIGRLAHGRGASTRITLLPLAKEHLAPSAAGVVATGSSAARGAAGWTRDGSPARPGAPVVGDAAHTNGHGAASEEQPLHAGQMPGAPPPAPLLSATAPGEPRAEPGRAGGRVSLLQSRFDDARGVCEVTLALGGAKGTGRAPAGPLLGGAQATLVALGALGLEVPFYLVSVERAQVVPGEPVLVVLAPRRAAEHADGAAERIGVAAGQDDVEAASRATLSALNRHLARSALGR